MTAHGTRRSVAVSSNTLSGATAEHRALAPPRSEKERSIIARVSSFARTSAWASVAGRVALFAAGLLLLAWIGRAATAATSSTTPQALATTTSDAGSTFAATSAAQPAPAPPAVVGPPPVPSPSSHARATAEDPVFVNHAGVDELRRLPGVGPKRAEAIVALRQRIGRFQRVEDLLRVKGVGRATLRKWRPLLRLDSPVQPDAGVP